MGADRFAALAAGVPLEDPAGPSSGDDHHRDAASDDRDDGPDEADPPDVTERRRATTARVTAEPGPPDTGHPQDEPGDDQVAATLRDKRRSDVRLAGLTASGNAAATARAAVLGIGVVSDAGPTDGDAAEVVALPTAFVGHAALAPLKLLSVNLSDQRRFSAAKIRGPLGWDRDAELRAHVDAASPAVWVQLAASPVATTDTVGSECSCERCVEATGGLPVLPGAVRPSSERVAIDGKDRLVLTPGLAAAARVGPDGDAIAIVVPALHAVAIASATALIAGRLAHIVEPVRRAAAEEHAAVLNLAGASTNVASPPRSSTPSRGP